VSLKAKAEELFNKEWRDIDEDDRICFKHFLNQIKSKKKIESKEKKKKIRKKKKKKYKN